MESRKENFFRILVKLISIVSSILLLFIIIFILRESMAFFKELSPLKFIGGRNWNPMGQAKDLGILPIILATVYIGVLAIVIALPVGLAGAIFLACYLDGRKANYLRIGLDILAGIPSVVYGFMGLMVIVKFFESKMKMSSGESVLAGGILLSIMVLPYIISTTSDAMERIYKKYIRESKALGVSKSYFIRRILIPESRRSIVAGMVLAFGRALGETMAVMMVIGNAPIMPRLLGKCQTISSLIALEMGMVEVGSLHYHALFSAGFILMIILIIINTIFYFLKKNIEI